MIIFFCLESARDVVSIPSLLITVTGVVCTASHSEQGRGCAPEVRVRHKHTSALLLSAVTGLQGVTYSSADVGLSFS